MVYCGSFGCGCCTCLECMNWKEQCKCEIRPKIKAFVERNKDSEDPQIIEAIELLGELDRE